jgi:mannitol operon transcriptional antiterminator
MNKLRGRQLQILRKILSATSTRIEDIMKEFDISKRTVYREIASINEFVKNYNLKIVNKTYGLAIEGNIADIEKLKLDIVGYPSEFETKERRKMILSELLQLKEAVKLQYFSKKFGVTTSTISYDLKELEKWLKKQGLTLITKPGYGVYISGSENSFRKAIANFLYENFDTKDLIDFLKTGFLAKNNIEKNIDLRLLNLIDYDTVLKIEKAILKVESEIDYEIVESSYLGLVVHLALAIKRLKFAKKLAKYLQEELDISIPEDEIGYVTIHLIGAKYRSTTQNYNDKDIEIIAWDMIKEAEKIFDVSFSKDEFLEDGLKSHLVPAVYRLKMGLDIRNPLLEDIKTKYPLLFEKSNRVCDVLRKRLNLDIPEDEIGYIAMHFGAALERKKEASQKYNIICQNFRCFHK